MSTWKIQRGSSLPDGRDAFTRHVSPPFRMAESEEEATDMLVRWVEAVAAHGGVAGELIPDVELRREARREPSAERGEAP
jgi:hypothetical protein